MNTTKTQVSRVNSFTVDADISDFQPKVAPTQKPSKEDIDKISQETGFLSRQAPTQKPGGRRRYTTGRNQQLNIKVTEETLRRFYAIADDLGVPLGEVFDRAVRALENTR